MNNLLFYVGNLFIFILLYVPVIFLPCWIYFIMCDTEKPRQLSQFEQFTVSKWHEMFFFWFLFQRENVFTRCYFIGIGKCPKVATSDYHQSSIIYKMVNWIMVLRELSTWFCNKKNSSCAQRFINSSHHFI